MSRLLSVLSVVLLATSASAQYPPAAQFQAAIAEYEAAVGAVVADSRPVGANYLALQNALKSLRAAGVASDGSWPHSGKVSEYAVFLTSSRWTVFDAACKGLEDRSLPVDTKMAYWVDRTIAGACTSTQANGAMAARLQAALAKMKAVSWD